MSSISSSPATLLLCHQSYVFLQHSTKCKFSIEQKRLNVMFMLLSELYFYYFVRLHMNLNISVSTLKSTYYNITPKIYVFLHHNIKGLKETLISKVCWLMYCVFIKCYEYTKYLLFNISVTHYVSSPTYPYLCILTPYSDSAHL